MPLAPMTGGRGERYGYQSSASRQSDTLDRGTHSSASRRDRRGVLSRFLCGVASGMIPSFAGLKKRRTFNVAAVLAVLLGSVAAGVFGGVVVWAFCEFDHELRYGP
jgi:hypothetical protein